MSRALLLCFCLALAASAPQAGGAIDRPAGTPGAGESVEAVGRLIQESSGAEQIKASGVPEALAKYDRAKEIYERAVQAQRSGDADATKRLLNEATRTMFEAVRLAKSQAVVAEKERTDFNRRLRSLNELLKADARISKEKHRQDANGQGEGEAAIQEKIARAQALFDAGQLPEARAVLDEAYTAAKGAIERLRGGDTLVRSLNFQTKEEEFRYELDRNETHRLLLKSMVEDKADRPELKAQTQAVVERAAALRKDAEAAAAGGGYEKAIELLEKSTTELLRGLRAAGVFIPG